MSAFLAHRLERGLRAGRQAAAYHAAYRAALARRAAAAHAERGARALLRHWRGGERAAAAEDGGAA